MSVPTEISDCDGLRVEIVRTRRKKTIALSVVDGGVRVLAPKRVSTEEIMALVRRKANWVEKKRQQPQRQEKSYCSGEVFVLLGETVQLQVQDGRCTSIELQQDQLVVCLSSRVRKRTDRISSLIHGWYQQQAEVHIQQRIDYYAARLGVTPRAMQVKRYKRRWGSCSSRGDLTFNWRIIIAPPAIVDYVVVHELCHLIHHNHRPEFWRCVESILPDYRQRQAWLKTNGSVLSA